MLRNIILQDIIHNGQESNYILELRERYFDIKKIEVELWNNKEMFEKGILTVMGVRDW